MTKQKGRDNLTADDVMAWLERNPRFFQQHPEILDILHPPQQTENGKGVADFQHYMLKRLREDRDEVIQSAREMVETSRANMNSQSRIHTAALMLLDARDFEDLMHILTMDLAALLDVDIVGIIVETDGRIIPHINLAGVRAVSAGTVDLMMKDRKVLLESGVRGLDDIYGGGAALVKSQALLRLDLSRAGPPALIAFGSREPGLFQDGQGTELIGFLGKIIERAFRLWLDLPPP